MAPNIPGPDEAAIASSPMKKSRSSVPRFPERWPVGPAPPVRKDGLFPTAGRPEPEAAPAAGPLVAIAVGNTKEGESLPAKPGGMTGQLRNGEKPGEGPKQDDEPSLENPVPLQRGGQ